MNVHGVGIGIFPGNGAGRRAVFPTVLFNTTTETTESASVDTPKVNGAVRLRLRLLQWNL